MDRVQAYSSAPTAVPMPFARQDINMVTNGYMTGAQPSQYFSQQQCSTIRGMGISQIVMGSFATIFGIAILVLSDHGFNYLTGSGIWTGIFIIITGSFGITAANKNTRCVITSCVVLNIISFLMVVSLVVVSGISFRPIAYYCGSEYSSDGRDDVCSKWKTYTAMESLNLVIGLAQLVITLVSSAICCGALGCQVETSNPYRVEHNDVPICAPREPAGAAAPYPSAGASYQPIVPGVYYPSAPGHSAGQAFSYFAAPQNFQQVDLQTYGQVSHNSDAQSKTTTGQGQSSFTEPSRYEVLAHW